MSKAPLIIDVMGESCPIPVKRLRTVLISNPVGEIRLIGDDPESLHDIPALLERMGLQPPEVVEIEGGWRFVISAG